MGLVDRFMPGVFDDDQSRTTISLTLCKSEPLVLLDEKCCDAYVGVRDEAKLCFDRVSSPRGHGLAIADAYLFGAHD